MNIANKKFLTIVLSTLIMSNVTYAAWSVADIKDHLYEKIKESKIYSFNDALNQVNRFNKPNMNQSLPIKEVPKDNRLVIPKIGMNLKILELESVKKLSHGLWRIPDSSTPDQKHGNTVLIGHRHSNAGGVNKPWDLFYLPEVKIGEKISVYYKGKKYNYEVISKSIEDPEDSDIEYQPADDRLLTVYTCYPLWTDKYRYAVQARYIDSE